MRKLSLWSHSKDFFSCHTSIVVSCCPVMFVFQMKEFCHVTCPFVLPGDVCVSNEGVFP